MKRLKKFWYLNIYDRSQHDALVISVGYKEKLDKKEITEALKWHSSSCYAKLEKCYQLVEGE